MNGQGERKSDATTPRPVVPAETAEELYEQAPCGYLSTLPDGTVIRVNETLLSWTGYTEDELVGARRFADLLTAGGRIYYETHLAPLLAMQGSVRVIAVDIVCADGQLLPALVNSTLVRDPTGEPRVIRTSILDATDRRAYERELLRARERARESEAHARLLAATLQASLLPPSLPVVPGIDVAAAYRPAGSGDEVGGDFYDVFDTGNEDWVIVLGDVRGKGAPAATVTALARHTLRAVAVRAEGPAAALEALNTALLRDSTDRFCTVVCLRLRLSPPGRVHVTFASAGHALPLHITDRDVAPVGRPGTLLGLFPDPELHDATVTLGPGEALFTYTDGLPDGRRHGEFFGERRLREELARLRGHPLVEIPHTVVERIVDFQGGNPRDDMAAVIVGPQAHGPQAPAADAGRVPA